MQLQRRASLVSSSGRQVLRTLAPRAAALRRRPLVHAAAATSLYTCRRCKGEFTEAANSATACRYHPAIYTGGEVAKAVGFVRQSSAPEHQLQAVMGRRGLMRFWDCCGDEDENAPGCCRGWHVSFDSELNAAKGWKE